MAVSSLAAGNAIAGEILAEHCLNGMRRLLG
jgi:hypothetical protein